MLPIGKEPQECAQHCWGGGGGVAKPQICRGIFRILVGFTARLIPQNMHMARARVRARARVGASARARARATILYRE